MKLIYNYNDMPYYQPSRDKTETIITPLNSYCLQDEIDLSSFKYDNIFTTLDHIGIFK